MSRTLKVTGNHVMYDRGAWFLRVIMSSSRALCCLLSVKKQKLVEKIVDDKDTQNTKRSTRAVCWLHEREKTERTWGKERVDTNFENKHSVSKRERKKFVQRIIKQLLDSIFVISRIIKLSVRVITPTSTLIILDITKTSSNNCLWSPTGQRLSKRRDNQKRFYVDIYTNIHNAWSNVVT